MTKPQILLSVGSLGWAFDNIAKQLTRRLSRYKFATATMADVSGGAAPAVAVSFFWGELGRLRARLASHTRIIACLYDHVSWSQPQERQQFVGFTNHQAALLVVGSPLLATAAAEAGITIPIVCCPDGVDLKMFTVQPPPPTFTAGWTGNAAIREGDHKGVGLIRAACEAAGVPLVVQGYEDRIPQATMAAQFYRRISVYVCASLNEGTPNPVLEALACGRPVITTRVGITDQLVEQGVNGCFVERSAEAITAAIRRVREWDDRREVCRHAVDPRHGWDVASARWGAAIDQALAS